MGWQRGKSYAQDLRDRVFVLADGGLGVTATAQHLRVSSSYVSKVLSRRRSSGEVSARPQRSHVTPRLAGLGDAIRAKVAAEPDATIAGLRGWLAAAHAVSASDGLMHKTLARLRLTLKKSRSALPNRTARMSPRRAQPGANGSPG